MHKFTPAEVADESFDLTKLKIPQEEMNRLHQYFLNLREKIRQQKTAANASAGKSHYYNEPNDSEIFAEQKVLTNQHYLSMVFHSTDLSTISSYITGNSRWLGWVLTSAINSWIGMNSVLSKRILFYPGSNETFKQAIVANNYINTEELLTFISNRKVLQLPEFIQARLLEICNPSDAATFVDSDYDKVKLAAYKKLGPINYMDAMVKDPHAIIRRYAISILSPGDKRLASFINDRSQDIFCQALMKISAEHIPMMLGSNHLKKKRAKNILNQRLGGGVSA
jgi:hypothetical protein